MPDEKTTENQKPVIYIDHRELNSRISEFLIELGAELKTQQLHTGDYICSDRVAVERKTVSDFLGSIFDQRIFEQLRSLSDSYPKPVLLIEGNPELLFLERAVNPNAVRGVLASIAIDYGIPIMWTLNPRETAAQLYWIAYREQIAEKRPVSIRSTKKSWSIARQQEFLVAGLPGISTKRARQLLKKFRTPKKVFCASGERLKKLDGFGEKRAKQMKEILETEYKEE